MLKKYSYKVYMLQQYLHLGNKRFFTNQKIIGHKEAVDRPMSIKKNPETNWFSTGQASGSDFFDFLRTRDMVNRNLLTHDFGNL